MGKVFIVNYSGHNVEPAKQYGSLHYLTRNSVNVFCTDRLKLQLIKDMRNYNNKEDYILLSGAIILNLLVVLEALKHGPKVRILIYNFKISRYIVRTI